MPYFCFTRASNFEGLSKIFSKVYQIIYKRAVAQNKRQHKQTDCNNLKYAKAVRNAFQANQKFKEQSIKARNYISNSLYFTTLACCNCNSLFCCNHAKEGLTHFAVHNKDKYIHLQNGISKPHYINFLYLLV